MTKAALRAQIRATLGAMEPVARDQASAAVFRRASALPEFTNATSLMAFLSLPDEIDTRNLLMAAFSAGKRVAAPCADWDARAMRAVEMRSIDDVRETGPHGIREPANGWQGGVIPRERLELILVPGLAFDERGARLGRAAGFYDRFLAQPGLGATRMALAFDCQIVERVPTEPHDQGVDLIVTESRVIRPA
ncbi:5-formyltetrahydrofolate cyclo-ligase [Nitrospira sp.]|nr:5-formyltetrahydrofolate cyclo-ligase [Nitrospira sp.]